MGEAAPEQRDPTASARLDSAPVRDETFGTNGDVELRTGGSRHDRRVLLILFALSGFSGLVYESIWTRYLGLFLGHASHAQALVLAIYMGGMAAGAALAARRSGRLRNVLLAYAAAEAALGVLALVFHELYGAATALAYDAVLPRLAGSGAAVATFRWTLAALLIVPQSVLLGTTFPLMTAGVLRAFPGRPGRSISLLYFTNSLGAAAGGLVSGYLLVGAVGLPGTVRAAGVLNLAVAAEVLRRFRGRDRGEATAAAPMSPPRDAFLAALLAVAALTGASSFLYEVSWIRMLTLVLGASTHAFELMLAAFVLGLALGSLWMRRRLDALASPVRFLALVQLAMGVLALATLPAYARTFDVMRWLMEALPVTSGGYALFSVSSGAIALGLMLPATFCAGTTLPLVTAALLRRGHGEGSVGAVYAANTVGAIVAVLLGTQVAMPLLGAQGLLALGAAIDLALGLALAWKVRDTLRGARVRVALAAGAVAAAVLALGGFRADPARMASGVYRFGSFLDPELDRVVFHRDGKTATVSVIRNDATGQLRIATNGKVDAAVTLGPGLGRPPQSDELTMVLLGALPLAHHPEARTAACIGFGAGVTTSTLLASPAIERVDTVEIEEAMIRGAEVFRPRNEAAYGDPRSHVHLEDAKTFFSTAGRRYDVIVSEPSNPWVSGVAGLFSAEFYARARAQLNEGGVFVQWLQLYEIYPGLVASVLKALEPSFSDYVVYAPNDVDAIIVARNGGVLAGPDPAIFGDPALGAALHGVGIDGVQDLEVRRIGDRRSWDGLTRTFAGPANSDFEPVLDQNGERARFLNRDSAVLGRFLREELPALELLSPGARPGGPTAVTDAAHSTRVLRARHARIVRDLLLDRRAASLPDLGGERAADASALAAYLHRCADEPQRTLPLGPFVRVARATMPDLSAGELAAMWQPIATGPCARSLDPLARAWRDVVVAASARDGAALAGAARALLDGFPLSPDDVAFAVTAGMLGSLAQGDAPAAERLWARHGAGLDIRHDVLLRVLVARARAGSASARP